MSGGVREPKDALSIAMRHANELLSKMNLSVDGAIARASDIFVDDGEIPYATFESNFYSFLYTRSALRSIHITSGIHRRGARNVRHW